jgi:hypothetical protein
MHFICLTLLAVYSYLTRCATAASLAMSGDFLVTNLFVHSPFQVHPRSTADSFIWCKYNLASTALPSAPSVPTNCQAGNLPPRGGKGSLSGTNNILMQNPSRLLGPRHPHDGPNPLQHHLARRSDPRERHAGLCQRDLHSPSPRRKLFRHPEFLNQLEPSLS